MVQNWQPDGGGALAAPLNRMGAFLYFATPLAIAAHFLGR